MTGKSATINVSMPPRSPYQPSQPQTQQPQRSFNPQTPHLGYGSPSSQHFQRHESGHYEVVPTPQPIQNDGRSGHNPYDFIVNPNSQTRPGLGLSSLLGGSLMGRVALLGGGLVVIMIVVAVLMSALSPKSVTPELISITQRQQEIIRVSTAAVNQTTSSDAKNFVTNVEASVTTSQVQVIAYLASHGQKLNNKTLGLDKDPQTDAQLTNAATANNYDSAVTQNMITQLQNYEGQLQTAFNATSSVTLKATLQNNYNTANLLLKQAQTLQAELNG